MLTYQDINVLATSNLILVKAHTICRISSGVSILYTGSPGFFECHSNVKTIIVNRDAKFENFLRGFMAGQDYFSHFEQAKHYVGSNWDITNVLLLTSENEISGIIYSLSRQAKYFLNDI